ncbi:MAG: nuclear transport factor 2 family protein [Gaiellaceae bacterium]
MSEQATRTPTGTIGEKPLAYFKAVDSLDPDAVLAHFADDATLTVQTARVTFTGTEEIRRMFIDFFAEWESMVHTVTNLVVDVEAGTVATEQHVDLVADATTKMHNCNFFTVNEDGEFSRVIIWMDGVNPLT